MEDIQQDLISQFDVGGGTEEAPEQSHNDTTEAKIEDTPTEHSPQEAGGVESEDRPPEGNREIVEEDAGSEGDDKLPPHLEKRLKDTYSNYSRERNARLELERQVAQLQGQMDAIKQEASNQTSQPVSTQEAYEKFRADFDEDPEAAIEKLVQSRIDELQEQISEIGSRDAKKEAARLDQQEAKCREKYQDYDEVMVPFLELLKTDPKVHEAWVSNGRTAEAAYQLARKKAAFDKYLDTGEMPEVEKSDNGEPTKPPNRRGRTLSNVQSQSPSAPAKSGPAKGIPTHPSQFASHLFGDR